MTKCKSNNEKYNASKETKENLYKMATEKNSFYNGQAWEIALPAEHSKEWYVDIALTGILKMDVEFMERFIPDLKRINVFTYQDQNSGKHGVALSCEDPKVLDLFQRSAIVLNQMLTDQNTEQLKDFGKQLQIELEKSSERI